MYSKFLPRELVRARCWASWVVSARKMERATFQSVRSRLPARLQGGRLVGLPDVGQHVAGDEAMAKRLEAAPPGDPHARRIAAHARHGDRRVRLLQRLVDVADARLRVDRLFQADRPELPLDLVGRLGRPQLQDHVDGLIDHGGGVLRLGAVQLLVGRHAAGPEAEVEPALGQMIEERQPAGDMWPGGAG